MSHNSFSSETILNENERKVPFKINEFVFSNSTNSSENSKTTHEVKTKKKRDADDVKNLKTLSIQKGKNEDTQGSVREEEEKKSFFFLIIFQVELPKKIHACRVSKKKETKIKHVISYIYVNTVITLCLATLMLTKIIAFRIQHTRTYARICSCDSIQHPSTVPNN